MPLTKLNFTGQPTLSHANLPAGSILQKEVYNFATTGHLSTTSTTSAQVGTVQVSITPKKANSKILIEAITGMAIANQSYLCWELYQDSTPLIEVTNNYSSSYYYGWVYTRFGGSGSSYAPLQAKHVVDAGSTTSRTYKLYHRNFTGSGIAYSAHAGTYISMYATEIAQ